MVSLSGSARGGKRFQDAELDTLGAVEELGKEHVPMLFLHGTRDANVAVEIPIYLLQVRPTTDRCRPIQVPRDNDPLLFAGRNFFA